MRNTRYKFGYSYRISIVSFLLHTTFFSTSCEEKDEDNLMLFELTAEKVSETQARLDWTQIEYNSGYHIWRTFKEFESQPELIVQADSTTNYFYDIIEEDQPLGSPVTYYVSTTTGGTEIQSNEVELIGRTVWNFGPYQLELIPEEKMAIARDLTSLILMDYEKKIVLKRLEFPGRIGQFDIQEQNGIIEVFVPCSDHKIYIHEATSLSAIDSIDTGESAYAVAVNSQGKIFCSGMFDRGNLHIYDRKSLQLSTTVRAEKKSVLFLQDDSHLVTFTSTFSPGSISHYTFNDQGELIAKTDDPYHAEYRIDHRWAAVSSNYIVTTTEGFVFTADENMTYVTKLTKGESYQSDFEFSSEGTIIYSTLTNQKAVLKSTIEGNTAVSTKLPTKGYPWFIARDGNTLVILSSPELFYPARTGGLVSLETITLQ